MLNSSLQLKPFRTYLPEMLDTKKKGQQEKAMGRSYYPEDFEKISAPVVSSGYLSVLVLKCVFDQRYIFRFQTKNAVYDSRPFFALCSYGSVRHTHWHAASRAWQELWYILSYSI